MEVLLALIPLAILFYKRKTIDLEWGMILFGLALVILGGGGGYDSVFGVGVIVLVLGGGWKMGLSRSN